MSNFSDMVRTAISEKADIIFSGAGLPLDLPSYLREDSTTKLVPIVSSARAARVEFLSAPKSGPSHVICGSTAYFWTIFVSAL